MIVKIKFKLGKGTFTMLFGDSYKSWKEQLREYCTALKLHDEIKVLGVETSKEEWISWGGLKWCNEQEFQDELDREGCQEGEPNNPEPRKYADMRFGSNKVVEKVVEKIVWIMF